MSTRLRHLVLAVCLLSTSPAWALSLSLWDPAAQAVFDLVNLQRGFLGLGTLNADSRLHDAALGHSTDMALNDYFAHTNPFTNETASQRVTAAGYAWTSTGENIAAGQGQLQLGQPLNAAREVMYGTAALTLLSDFDVTLGNGGFAGWDEVGDLWSDADWDAWETNQLGFGGWMGSSGHRDNVRNAGYTDLGVGYYYEAGDQGNVLIPGVGNANGPFFTYWTQNFAAGDSAPVPLPPAVLLLAAPLLALRRRRRLVRGTTAG